MISKIGAFALARGRVRSVPVAVSLAAAALALASSPSLAQGFTETPTTDLSDSGLSPTVVAFTLGSNIVSGTSGHDLEGAIDRDYFTFTLGTDQALRAINILPATQTIDRRSSACSRERR